MRKLFFFLLFLALFTTTAFSSEEPRKLKTIVVTSSRLQASLETPSRSVLLLGSDILCYSSYEAIPDEIASVGGVDIRRRGPEGVQADINIRGSTFEQNTVLIDGIRINDPQTGHFDMDLPLTRADIDRIEIVKGASSSLYGPNAFGGVINFITKKPQGKSVAVICEGGEFDYFRSALAVTYPLASLNSRFSIEESRSTGYMPETGFNILSISNSTNIDTFLGVYDFFFGYTKKDFGADSFYSNLFSNEEEHTDTRFFKIDGKFEEGDLRAAPKLFLRRHRDKFALDINRPGWQTNYHTNYTYGAGMDCVLDNDFLSAAYGFEISRDTIDSTNIQTHSRTSDGFYIELSPRLSDDLDLSIGVREDYFSGFGWRSSPSVSASYALTEDFTLRGSIGSAYRIPTFTDLYYNDSANIGDPYLRPESSWNYEIGAGGRVEGIDISADIFHRDSFDTIDWVRASAGVPWRVSNIGTVNTNGIELSLKTKNIFISYTALDSYRKHDYLSKYALDYLKHHLTAGAMLDVSGFKNYWVLNFKKRVGNASYLVVDTKVTREIFRKDGVSFTIFLEASNLFDTDYSEQSNVPMPGRWVKSGARIEF